MLQSTEEAALMSTAYWRVMLERTYGLMDFTTPEFHSRYQSLMYADCCGVVVSVLDRRQQVHRNQHRPEKRVRAFCHATAAGQTGWISFPVIPTAFQSGYSQFVAKTFDASLILHDSAIAHLKISTDFLISEFTGPSLAVWTQAECMHWYTSVVCRSSNASS